MATYRNRPAYATGGLGIRLALARLIRAVGTIAAAIIVAAIVLHLLGAKTSNGVVHAIHQAGSWLSSWSHGLFSIQNSDWNMVVNWGIAAVVYFVAAHFIARALAR
jgi:hypothetical protein